MTIEEINQKLSPVTPEEIAFVKEKFYERLKSDGISQNQWAMQQGIMPHHVSNILNQKLTSAPILRLVCDYILSP